MSAGGGGADEVDGLDFADDAVDEAGTDDTVEGTDETG